jgi:hypothetical protein
MPCRRRAAAARADVARVDPRLARDVREVARLAREVGQPREPHADAVLAARLAHGLLGHEREGLRVERAALLLALEPAEPPREPPQRRVGPGDVALEDRAHLEHVGELGVAGAHRVPRGLVADQHHLHVHGDRVGCSTVGLDARSASGTRISCSPSRSTRLSSSRAPPPPARRVRTAAGSRCRPAAGCPRGISRKSLRAPPPSLSLLHPPNRFVHGLALDHDRAALLVRRVE